MDITNKSLAQLAEENKGAKFVTLEVGSTISGYTKEYLDRLCRLNKVEYRLWHGDQFVIELNSLLAETHTILLSYEGISFVDVAELHPSLPHIIGNILTTQVSVSEKSPPEKSGGGVSRRLFSQGQFTQSLPHFGEDNEDVVVDETSPLSVVGQTVFSGPLQKSSSAEEEKVVVISPSTLPKENAPTPSPQSSLKAEITRAGGAEDLRGKNGGVPAKEIIPIASVATRPPQLTPPAPSVSTSEPETSHEEDNEAVITSGPVVILPHAHHRGGGWDAALLSGRAMSAFREERSAEYHPIQTAIDASTHHDPAPLFPKTRNTIPIKNVNKWASIQSSSLVSPGDMSPIPALQGINNKDGDPSDALSFVSTSATLAPKELSVPPPPVSRPTIPMKKIMPALTTAPVRALQNMSEHHLVLAERHALLKSSGFNSAMIIAVVAVSILYVGGAMLGTEEYRGGANLAGVGAAITESIPPSDEATMRKSAPTSSPTLPFSDEIVVAEGEDPGTVYVQPVFKSGVGEVYEYPAP